MITKCSAPTTSPSKHPKSTFSAPSSIHSNFPLTHFPLTHTTSPSRTICWRAVHPNLNPLSPGHQEQQNSTPSHLNPSHIHIHSQQLCTAVLLFCPWPTWRILIFIPAPSCSSPINLLFLCSSCCRACISFQSVLSSAQRYHITVACPATALAGQNFLLVAAVLFVSLSASRIGCAI